MLPLLLALSCAGPADSVAPAAVPRGDAPALTPPAPVLKRLTQAQYTNSVHALLGDTVIVPDDLEPDTSVEGLLTLGGTTTSLSPTGVEQAEDAAYRVAEQAFTDGGGRTTLVPCTPADVVDAACARTALAAFGRRAWRRSLDDAELTRLTDVSGLAAATLGDFYTGLEYGFAAILQSPWFLYRVELGEADPAGGRRYTSTEMATRLAYFIWNSTPDDELLDAGEAGELVTEEGLAAQVDRLLADPRAHVGVRNFFDEMYTLYDLEDLSKDPTVYVHMGDGVGSSAREQTLLDAEWLVFDEDGDFRQMYTSRHTHLDRKLAAIYAVRAPAHDGFGETDLPDDHTRRGFTGQVSFLALQAHPTTTSPTRRGKFVREVLLCSPVPAPPAGVDTSIPEPTPEAPTMRDRLTNHVADPYCAGCHTVTDPIGLGFENFDGLGGWRTQENDVTIDASGDLDGAAFTDAWELADAIADHPLVGTCLTRTLYQYATAHVAQAGEGDQVAWHEEGLEGEGWRVGWLMRDIALGAGFRRVGEVQ